MAATSQRKGAIGELEFMKELQKRLPWTTLTRNTYEQRVVGGVDILGLPGFAIEVKRYGRSPTGWYQSAWWDQCVSTAAELGAIPLLGYRYNNAPWRVVIPWMFDDPDQPVVTDLDTFCAQLPEFVNCDECGQAFEYTAPRRFPRKFCSSACKQKQWRKKEGGS